MRKILLILSTLLIFSSLTFASTVAERWNGLDETHKLVYVMGYKNGEASGIAINTIYLNKTKQELETEKIVIDGHKILHNTDDQQIVVGIDKFYSDYANAQVPISLAFYIIAERLWGSPEERVQKSIEGYRKQISEYVKEQ